MHDCMHIPNLACTLPPSLGTREVEREKQQRQAKFRDTLTFKTIGLRLKKELSESTCIAINPSTEGEESS